LLVSGNGKLINGSWYERIANAATANGDNPLITEPAHFVTAAPAIQRSRNARLTQALPTGSRTIAMNDAQQHGIWLHGLMQHLSPPNQIADMQTLQQRLGIPARQMPDLWKRAQQLLTTAHLQRFFAAQHYQAASNEVSYVQRNGELRRIDRLVEFATESGCWIQNRY